VMAGVVAAGAAEAASLPVAHASFESPAITEALFFDPSLGTNVYVSTEVPGWEESDSGATPLTGDAAFAGRFLNVPSPFQITNAAEDHLAFLSSRNGSFIRQVVTDGSDELVYEPGVRYTLTIGVTSSFVEPVSYSETLNLSLLYEIEEGVYGEVATTPIVASDFTFEVSGASDPLNTGFAAVTTLLDREVTASVASGEAWAGKPIVLFIGAAAEDGAADVGGDSGAARNGEEIWDVDDVRLTATPVPAPGAAACAALLAPLVAARRHRRR